MTLRIARLLSALRGPQQDERGLGGIEGLAFGALIFVFGTLIIATAWGAIDARLGVDAAAREAARAYVEAGSSAQATASAQTAATDVLRGHNRHVTRLDIDASGFSRCAPVTVIVETNVPKVSLPLIGRRSGTYIVRATHTEVVDPYRSGLSGTANC